ncbi:glucoamylase family protein [Sphingomonas sp. MS122]|uniref:glucoamylase family protein n=1 Tax=Sphingomonas sp. MS122 TaxID=3412683 RepID=UPI003C2DF2C7
MRIPVSRRTLLAAPALGALAFAPADARPLLAGTAKPALPDWYADLERRTFDFFWELANRNNGLVPDRWPTPSFCSIASVGYALTAYPVGVERGWVTRAAAAELTRTTLRFFWDAPQGPEPAGKAGYKGFFYHFIDMETGHRFRNVELSSVDTTILFMGTLFAGEYFDADNAVEAEIRKLAADLYARADWNFFRSDGRAAISMGWHPETGLIAANWQGYNEGMFVYILALASPTHAVPANSWEAWTAKYAQCWRGTGETRHLAFAPLFGHQYSHAWIDFRGIRDKPMREAGFDYFENSRRATYANRAYCMANPMGWAGYSRDIWGLTACDGPGNYQLPFKGRTATFYGYAARGPLGQPDERDDGTVAPTAALGSLPFAPEIVIPAAEALRKWPGLYDKYGFRDAINPSFTWTDKKLEVGKIDGEHGWLGTDYIGIDQGPILLQAANYRSDFVWRRMRGSKAIRRGLELAGFTGGWLTA